MSREEISQLFDSGLSFLNQAKSNAHSPSYGDLLAEAKYYLDQVVELTERDDPSFSSYADTQAFVHALCVILVDYSSDLDEYFASSPLIETLNTWFRNGLGQPAEEPQIEDQELDDFWAGVARIQDERSFSLDNPALLSPGALAVSTDALGEVISRSARGTTSSRVWSSCLSVVLYLRLDVYNPSEIALCISSLAVAADGTGDDALSDDIDPFLLRAVDPILRNPRNEVRQNSLQSLAAFYARKQLSTFNMLWGSYQANPNASSADLDDAIAASSEGMLWTQGIGIFATVRFELIFGYINATYERFSIFQRLEDLQDSVPFLQEALSYLGIAEDKMVAARRLYAAMSTDLADMLSKSSVKDDWKMSLTFWQQSVALTEPNAPDLAKRLFGLGNVSSELYRKSDDSEYFLEARKAYERAADATTDSAFIAQILFELASMFHHRFIITGVREELTNSVNAGNRACDLIIQAPSLAQDNSYWIGIYAHCGRLIRSIQESLKRDDGTLIDQLDLVIELCHLIIPHPNPSRLLAMNRLGLAYMTLARVQLSGGQSTAICLASLENALEAHQAALRETQPDDSLLHTRRTFVGATYYQMSGLPSIDDVTRVRYLDSAIDYLRLVGLAGGNLNTVVRLAKALEDRYRLRKQRSDLDECVSLLSDEGFHFGHSKVFLDAATQLVRICHENDLQKVVIPAYRRVFKALRRMTQLGLSSSKRQDAIVYSVGYACDAAASALNDNQADVAVELLEEGRNLFFSQLLPIQTETTAIKPLDPKLASRIDEILEQLRHYHRATDSAGYQANEVFNEGGFADDVDELAHDYDLESHQLLQYGKELEQQLGNVRELPGLSNFMGLKPFSELKRAALLCPVVYLSISQFRCDALVIGTEKSPDVLVVPLPTTSVKILSLSQTMRRTVVQQGRGVRKETPEEITEDGIRGMVQKGIKRSTPAQEVQNVLRQLWDTIVQPVLLALGYLNSGVAASPNDLPHICWCPSGPAATYLPLHAAGDYSRGPEHWAMTHVVSTYTPTLASLLRGVERESHTDARDARILLISQPASPPHLPLPGVVVERDQILATFEEIEGSSNVTSLHDKAGCVEEVIKQLSSHEMLHLACHGIQDMVDPLESSVILNDGQLAIREIIKTPLPKAELVYLSACQTATGSINTPDESFSLAGSFLFAGYKGAVATMWSINDGDGRDVATSFYKHILQRGGSPAANGAFALHCAIQELRAANPEITPIRWIPFVYFGVPGSGSVGLDQTTVT